MPLNRYFPLLFSLALLAHTAVEAKEFSLRTFPSLDRIRPLSEPVKVEIAVSESGGKPIVGEEVRIRLLAPAPGWFFSTDFPLVEGSSLIQLNLPAAQGKVEWEYVFPIRGTYRLEVQEVGGGNKTDGRVFELAVPESRLKFVFLGIFTIALFLSGVLAGRWLTGTLDS